MLLPALLTSDLHLTSNPRDEYRWKLFDWLADQCVHEQVKTLCILGDLTDAKDYHSAQLTNRIVEQMVRLGKLTKVLVMMGNHDYLQAGHAYFEFLSNIPGVTFIAKPYEDEDDGPFALFLPHTKDFSSWPGLNLEHVQYLFLHQTFSGAVASNGQRMDGEALLGRNFEGPKIYAGDIHVPQQLGMVEYVGSPYHVHFGDKFTPRCVLLDRRGRQEDLFFDSVRRVSLKVTSAVDFKRQCRDLDQGDHLKLTLQLTQADKHEWKKLRRELVGLAAEMGLVLHGVKLDAGRPTRRLLDGTLTNPPGRIRHSPVDRLVRFVEAEGLPPDVLDVGLELL